MTLSRLMATACLLLVLTATACRRQDAGPGAPAEPTSPPPTGRIEGVVRLRGAPPVPRTEPNGKTPEVCGGQVPVTRLELGTDNGVGQAFVYLDGVPATGPLRPAASLTIAQKDCLYTPQALVATPGARLEIVNDDPVLHNVHASTTLGNARQTVFNIAQPVRGQRTTIDTELKPGVLTLTCEAGHPWMRAHLLVADHGFVAVTNTSGRFVIDQVPAGTYPIRVWHDGVTLTRIIPSLQQFEYEPPYELASEVVVTAGRTSEVAFDLELR